MIAENLEAIVHLGMANSRMKDYFDHYILSRDATPDGGQMITALGATFLHRGTPLPQELPIGLTPAFADGRRKNAQWSAFLSRSHLDAPRLSQVVAQVVSTYGVLLLQAGKREDQPR